MIALLDKDLPGVRLTQTDRVLDDRLEDGLEREVRPTHREQHLVRRRLLLAQLRELTLHGLHRGSCGCDSESEPIPSPPPAKWSAIESSSAQQRIGDSMTRSTQGAKRQSVRSRLVPLDRQPGRCQLVRSSDKCDHGALLWPLMTTEHRLRRYF